MFETDWTMCSKYDYHFNLNSQHNWGDLCDHFMSTGNYTSITNKLVI